jgi:hypothetical protein
MKEGFFPIQSNPNRVKPTQKPMKPKLPLHHRAVINRVKPTQFHTSSTILDVLLAVHSLECAGITSVVQAEGGAL